MLLVLRCCCVRRGAAGCGRVLLVDERESRLRVRGSRAAGSPRSAPPLCTPRSHRAAFPRSPSSRRNRSPPRRAGTEPRRGRFATSSALALIVSSTSTATGNGGVAAVPRRCRCSAWPVSSGVVGRPDHQVGECDRLLPAPRISTLASLRPRSRSSRHSSSSPIIAAVGIAALQSRSHAGTGDHVPSLLDTHNRRAQPLRINVLAGVRVPAGQVPPLRGHRIQRGIADQHRLPFQQAPLDGLVQTLARDRRTSPARARPTPPA